LKLRQLIQLGQRALPSSEHGVVVLAYHLVGGGTASPVDLPIAEFTAQLDYLVEHCDVIGLRTAFEVAARRALRPRVVLTFDDAFENFASVAWPLLHERRLPSMLYVPVGFVSGTAGSPLRGASLPACTWSTLRELQASGVEMGSHGVQHVDLRQLDDGALERELQQSKHALRAELGSEIEDFCYVQGKHDQRVVAATKRHYRSATTGGGRRFNGRNLHRLPRFPVRRDDANFDRLVTAPVWLTEALADCVRQLRP
jgi:peptidoglycan/xylan/chitin deacetylase (PgdA/CDA1 family)